MGENPLRKKIYTGALHNGSAGVLHNGMSNKAVSNPALHGALNNPAHAGARKWLEHKE